MRSVVIGQYNSAYVLYILTSSLKVVLCEICVCRWYEIFVLDINYWYSSNNANFGQRKLMSTWV